MKTKDTPVLKENIEALNNNSGAPNTLYLSNPNNSTSNLAKDSKENRRRSISAFTLHSNRSFDQPKRRSFSSNRNSVSYSTSSNVANPTPTQIHSTINVKKTRTASNKGASFTKYNNRFFSSPQFSSSTPNLSPSFSKYIDSELRLSNKSVLVDATEFIIPTVIFKCCDFIENHDPVEGLFRMNGSIKQVNLIELELYKNLETFNFNDDKNTTTHDVAVVLKRWISKLDDGLITAEVCNLLTDIQKSLVSLDCLSELDQVSTDNDVGNCVDNESENSFIDMANSINLSESPIKHKNNSNANNESLVLTPESNRSGEVVAKSTNSPYKSPYSSSLLRLPIENLHLTLYLLNFLNYLSKPEISNITKMNVSNLSKVFQLNFFKSVDLTIGTKSFSTEDLKSSYLVNEGLLSGMIEQSQSVIDDLSAFMKAEKNQMVELLNAASDPKASLSDVKKSNTLYVKKRNMSTSSVSYKQTPRNNTNGITNLNSISHHNNTSTTEIYSITSSRNNSIDHIPFGQSHSKDSTKLDPRVETNTSSTSSMFGNANTESTNNGSLHYNDVNINDNNHNHNTNNNNKVRRPSAQTNANSNTHNHNLNNDHIHNQEKPHKKNSGSSSTSYKRKSIFGIFNKRKSSLPDADLQNRDATVTKEQEIGDQIQAPLPALVKTKKDDKLDMANVSCGDRTKVLEPKKSEEIRRESGDLEPAEETNAPSPAPSAKQVKQDKSQRRFSLFKFKKAS